MTSMHPLSRSSVSMLSSSTCCISLCSFSNVILLRMLRSLRYSSCNTTHPPSSTNNGPSNSTCQLHPMFVQIVKNCFPGLSRTCKDQIPGFSRTHKTRYQGLSRINSVHKHGCIRSKKCTYQISYQCNCITVTVFLKFKLTQKATNCIQRFTMNFFSS